MNHILDKNFNIRVSQRTKNLAVQIQLDTKRVTGVKKPLGALIGDLVYEKAKSLGIAECQDPATLSQGM